MECHLCESVLGSNSEEVEDEGVGAESKGRTLEKGKRLQ